MLRKITRKMTVTVITVVITILSVVSCLVKMNEITASAASLYPLKSYITGTSNIRTYSDSALTKAVGWIYPSDEVIIRAIGTKNGRYVAKCEYPVSRGTKTAWAALSNFTVSENTFISCIKSGNKTAKGSYTTYRRPGASKAGSIDKGDSIFNAGSRNGYTQVLYNIGSASNPTGWRLAWLTTDNYNRCVGSNEPISDYGTNSRNAFVNKALGEVGNCEYGNNDIKYNTWYWGRRINGSGYAWCDAFVSWCAYYSGVSKSVIPHYALVADTRNYYQNRGRFHSSRYYGGNYTPKKGDLVFYGSSGRSHIGIIIDSPKNGYLQTVEGNVNTSGNKWAVVKFTSNSKRTVNSSYVYGYASPDF